MSESFLERIVAHKRRELAERRAVMPAAELERAAAGAPAPRLSGGIGALFPAERLGVIAEVKRASPSKGAIALELDAVDQARGYAAGEADAISVLTDEEFYRGTLDDLRAIRAAVSMPVMRKDFILDRYGLLEARAAGADLVLLIVAALGRDNLARLMRDTAELGMVPLVEAYTRAEAELALEAGAGLIGVNNRDLHTFEVSLETTERLAPLLAPHATVVSLSGIWSVDDARRVVTAGARAVLVGEALVRAADPAAFIRELQSVSLTPRPPLPCAGEGELTARGEGELTARGEGELTGAPRVSPLPRTGEPVGLSERRETNPHGSGVRVPLVKICGVRTVEHARAAAEAGAGMVGLIFAASKRQVGVEEARAVTSARYARRPRFVGVFVNEDPDTIGRIAGEARLDLVQLSGEETPEECARLRMPYTKVVHVRDGMTADDILHIANQYIGAVAIVLDTAGVTGLTRWGGTGVPVDWPLAAEVVRRLGRPVVLAGGLRPDNVAAATQIVRPWGVDVSSGVETGGVKDIAKIRAFIGAATGAIEGVTS